MTATAARLTTGRVTAYTSVPRDGFVIPPDTPGIADEGPLAAAVAAMYPNIHHVRLSTGPRSPLDALTRNAFLYERPYLNLCNGVWVDAINDHARTRGLNVLLVGAAGNASFSYHGMHRLGEMMRAGALPVVLREAALLMRRGTAARTIAAQAIGPFLPRRVWRGISTLRGRADDLTGYSAITASAAAAPGLAARAVARGVDFAYQPVCNARAAQLQLLGRVDVGNYNKGTLGGWGIDVRDPSADRRLVEFCLSVPADQYLSDGVPRALARRAFADRLPAVVTNERRKGWQGADWHEGLTRARAAGRRARPHRTRCGGGRDHRYPALAHYGPELADRRLDAGDRRGTLHDGAAARGVDGSLHAHRRRNELIATPLDDGGVDLWRCRLAQRVTGTRQAWCTRADSLPAVRPRTVGGEG